MKGTTIIGISRGSQYSPNHISNDAAIFEKVAEELRKSGHTVQTYTETEFCQNQIDGSIVFNMARDTATIQRLKEMEDKGAIVINSGYGIDNCVRRPMTEMLMTNGVPHPNSTIASTKEAFPCLPFPCWIKRGNSHAIIKEDISFANNKEEADAILENFRRRGIPEAVINEHLQGDLIKFYGVLDTDFFYWFYPDPYSQSKFGLEKINGKAKGFAFDENCLKHHSEMAAKILNVPIYGGDCIVLSNGEIRIIDFNDWPSFACCRDKAAIKIAEYIHNLATKKTT